MKIDISAIVKPKRPIVLRPIATTQAQANRLYKIMVQPVRSWELAWENSIRPEYERTLSQMTADSPSDIEGIIERTDNGIVNWTLAIFRGLFTAWETQISMWHMRRFVGNLKYATNIDLTSIISSTPEPETIEAILQRNVNLVRSISDQTRERIADIVFRGLTSRTPVRDVAREIHKATGISRARARRIASDQTVKLSAALDRARLQEIGITEFQWIHSGKKHPREWHKERNGKRFKFNDPELRGDMPGEQPFCGCKAQGVIE